MSFTPPARHQDRPVAVIGAGTLGRRIALMFATRGGLVRIYDPAAEAGEAACAYVARELPEVVKTIDGGRLGTVEAVTDLAPALADAWLVIEAVPERLDLKKRLFADLDALAEPDAVLASNSSSYATSHLVDSVHTPERLLNLHFYMPPRQNAADVMSCGHTDPDVVALLLKVLPDYGIHPFEARRESTGFIFNRVWAAMKRECLAVVAEGVSTPADIDRMWQVNTGAAAGPFRLMDAIGLDVVLDIENHYAAERPGLPEGPRELLREYVDANRLGVKTGAGFYDDYPRQG